MTLWIHLINYRSPPQHYFILSPSPSRVNHYSKVNGIISQIFYILLYNYLKIYPFCVILIRIHIKLLYKETSKYNGSAKEPHDRLAIQAGYLILQVTWNLDSYSCCCIIIFGILIVKTGISARSSGRCTVPLYN